MKVSRKGRGKEKKRNEKKRKEKKRKEKKRKEKKRKEKKRSNYYGMKRSYHSEFLHASYRGIIRNSIRNIIYVRNAHSDVNGKELNFNQSYTRLLYLRNEHGNQKTEFRNLQIKLFILIATIHVHMPVLQYCSFVTSSKVPTGYLISNSLKYFS
jgi:hypothetical protein